ncbi:MAG: radical SAM protein, partial [Candidatus Omnitrophota bacterium]
MSPGIISPVMADAGGRLFHAPGIEAAGMKGGLFFTLGADDLVELPSGSELFTLPGRAAVGYDPRAGRFTRIDGGPGQVSGDAAYSAVAAFVSPGYTVTHNSAYIESDRCRILPLFSYAAVCYYRGRYHAACVRVDREKRQDLRCMDTRLIRRNAARFAGMMKGNRLVRHLTVCALTYGCPAAKNFFLHRYEAPLPSSPSCNSRCLGCISHQPGNRCPVTQPRIKFVPSPEEIADTALCHIKNTRDPVVSFGQGCEGEPLLAWPVIEKAVRLIRSKTAKGIINLNTNASVPDRVARLADAGLDSMRVSMNSAREKYYERYYKPRGYSFKDVLESVRLASKKGCFVSVNYLVMPGFSDSRDEIRAFRRL